MFGNRDKKKGRTDSKTDDLGIASTNVARSGNFFRSVSFTNGNAASGGQDTQGPQITKWCEAVEHPLTNKWRVIEVTRQPNLKTTGQQDAADFIDSRKALTTSYVSLDEAIESVLKFEQAQPGLGYESAGDTPEDYGPQHVILFALHEDKVPDLTGKLHVSVGGHVMTDGSFDPAILEKAREVLLAPKPAKADTAQELKLRGLFRHTAQAEDFMRLIDKRVDRAKWVEAVEALCAVAVAVQTMQSADYKTVEDKKILGSMSQEKWVGVAEYEKAVNDAKSILKKNGLMETPEERERFEDFFNQIQLAYEISFVKCFYNKVEKQEDPRGYSKDLKSKVEYATKKLRDFGGTDYDVKCMNAEIISGSKKFHLSDKTPEEKWDRLTQYGMQNGREYYWNDYRETGSFDGNNGSVYYFPESVIDFLVECDDITRQFDAEIRQEKERITTQKTTEETPKAEAPKKRKRRQPS